MKTNYEMMGRLEYLKATGHIMSNVMELVNEKGDNNGQDKEKTMKKKTKTFAEEDESVNMEETVIGNDVSRDEDPLNQPDGDE